MENRVLAFMATALSQNECEYVSINYFKLSEEHIFLARILHIDNMFGIVLTLILDWKRLQNGNVKQFMKICKAAFTKGHLKMSTWKKIDQVYSAFRKRKDQFAPSDTTSLQKCEDYISVKHNIDSIVPWRCMYILSLTWLNLSLEEIDKIVMEYQDIRCEDQISGKILRYWLNTKEQDIMLFLKYCVFSLHDNIMTVDQIQKLYKFFKNAK